MDIKNMNMEDYYYSLTEDAKDIDDVLVDLIESRNQKQAGRAIGILSGNDHIGALDNIVTKSNISLSPLLKDISGGETLTLSNLPENGNMYRIVKEGKLSVINKITITNLKLMDYTQKAEETGPIATTYDYYCTFIFKRGEKIQEPQDIMSNFEESSIKLLNPDLDISDFEVIHLLLFNDSENICALVSGY